MAHVQPLERHAPRWKIIVAFAALYVIWGSTYLAIRVAIESLPPFLMAGTRFVLAGGLMALWACWRGAPPPTARQWRSAVIIGALLLVGGNGGVVWACTPPAGASAPRVPSGLTALLVASTPVWMALFDWLRPGGVRPNLLMVAGLTGGLVGVGLLAGPGKFGGVVDPTAALVLMGASISWAAGSLYSRAASSPSSPILATGIQMVCGGGLLLIVGVVAGDVEKVALERLTLRSAIAFAYLMAFGSLIGFTAYVWLLRVVSPTAAGTYAYVNPLVALVLGWLLANEPLSGRVAVAAGVIVGSVTLLGAARTRRTPLKPVETGAPAMAAVGATTAKAWFTRA
ncbi:putative inner membrane transporter YedA [Phycisphaerae bacterium RAS1]|nr:putative inner membrane transporter YedA [Phycisphaerae bacterium RAS1]